MIWFGKLERLFDGPVPAWLPAAAEDRRMQFALERVAEVAPGLSGEPLLDALASTGWIDRPTAARLLPAFRHFDPDHHFCQYMRGLSFRGRAAEDAFLAGIRCLFEDVLGHAVVSNAGAERCVHFGVGDKEGVVIAHPEVAFTVSGRTRDAVLAAAEEMPDALVVVARTFDRGAAEQLGSILYRTGVPGTLVTVNLLLGIRATALRYGTDPLRVISLLSRGGTLRSADVATLGERSLHPAQRFHIPGWKSSSTV